MEVCYKEALVMPSKYIVMNEKEMTYVEGGCTYSKNFSYATCVAYKKFIEAGNLARRLSNQRNKCSGSLALLIGFPQGTLLDAAVYCQWSEEFFSAAAQIYKYRNDRLKKVNGSINVTGRQYFMTIKITSIR